MKLLVISTLLFGACFAQQQPQQQQQPQRRQYDEYQEQERSQPQQQQQLQQQDQPRQRNLESTTFIPIISYNKEQGNDGSYKASWETGNNILASEEGFLKELGPDPDSKDGGILNAQVQQGSYTYTAPDGQVITVNYIADEKGFHPTGDHLPTPPPVSEEVQKGLDLIYAGIRAQQEAADKDPEKARLLAESNDGQYRQ